MSFRSGLSQRTTLSGVFYSNSECVTYSNTETNLSLLASLQYVQNFTNYFIYLTYLPINNPTFEGIGMTGENITLSGNLSTPVINGSCNFTGSPKTQNQNFEYDILGEIKMVMNKIPNNYLLCDGASISTTDQTHGIVQRHAAGRQAAPGTARAWVIIERMRLDFLSLKACFTFKTEMNAEAKIFMFAQNERLNHP
jgi:hypothetical protein